MSYFGRASNCLKRSENTEIDDPTDSLCSRWNSCKAGCGPMLGYFYRLNWKNYAKGYISKKVKDVIAFDSRAILNSRELGQINQSCMQNKCAVDASVKWNIGRF